MKLINSLTILLASLSLGHFVNAQGTAFTYQGRLTENGTVANGTTDFTFTLYDAASGGAALGVSNVLNDFAVTNGLFIVALDFGAAFDGNARWLQIAVRPGASTGAYTNLIPRQPITATTYAMRAANFNGAVEDLRMRESSRRRWRQRRRGGPHRGEPISVQLLVAERCVHDEPGEVQRDRFSIRADQHDRLEFQCAGFHEPGDVDEPADGRFSELSVH